MYLTSPAGGTGIHFCVPSALICLMYSTGGLGKGTATRVIVPSALVRLT